LLFASTPRQGGAPRVEWAERQREVATTNQWHGASSRGEHAEQEDRLALVVVADVLDFGGAVVIVIAWDTTGEGDERDTLWWTGDAWTDAIGHAWEYADRDEADADLKIARESVQESARGLVDVQERV
jgi:hypothetical protein